MAVAIGEQSLKGVGLGKAIPREMYIHVNNELKG